ncbi:metal ABC transporter substrate-binding protein [Nocardioides marinquilinus]|uniref:Metal ABC transporter substrate-binding protein n=1 Tax=Nocardioides marinquilinus TaxID=1210400 RepID=A0ABP9PPD6_9ACTN
MRFTAGLAAAVLLATSGCAAFSDDTADGADDGEVTVSAAFYPLQYAAQRVAGDHASVGILTRPGGEPHDLELSIEQTADLSQADLVVYEEGFQPSVDEAVEQNATGETVEAASVVGLQPFDEEHAEDEHADEHEGEHESEHEGEEHAAEEVHSEDDGHDHEGGLDPHFWLDPLRMADLGDAVADQLSDIDPDHADDYAANAASLRDDLTALDESYTETLGSCERDTIVVSHDAFGYLDKYGLEVAGVAGLSPDAEPTPAGLADLQRLIADEGITTVFSERLASPAFTESLASDAGVGTAVLDPIEGLTDETADDDYLSLMQQNLDALATANGCR